MTRPPSTSRKKILVSKTALEAVTSSKTVDREVGTAAEDVVDQVSEVAVEGTIGTIEMETA